MYYKIRKTESNVYQVVKFVIGCSDFFSVFIFPFYASKLLLRRTPTRLLQVLSSFTGLSIHAWIIINPDLSEVVPVNLLHRYTVAHNAPNSLWDWCWIVQVQIWEGFLDGLSRLLGVVVRNSWVEVVKHVGGSNVVLHPVHETPSELVVWAIYRKEGAAHVVPLLSFQVRHVGVGVMQQSDNAKPSVEDEVWSTVDSSNCPEGGALGPVS
mmetsp:Transcript_8879/g.16489  ORF Transcript_8879/g.16489 Transcript_8879/m.16489 type:complete len:210 (-) Transcript_8879:1189-1818(-)